MLVGILAYILLQLAVGVIVSRRVATESDYLIAGRRLGYGLATFSIFATWFGAETCIGAAGAIYAGGLSAGSADPFGYGACLFLMALVFAVPLWRRGLTTLADLFRSRYSPGVERLAVLMMVPTSILWAAAQVRAFGQVLTTASGLEAAVTITLAAGVVIGYSTLGGLMADAVTDLIQGIVLAAGLLILLGAVLFSAGGASLEAVDPSRLRLFGGPGRGLLDGLEAWAVPICGSVVAQELVSRVLAARSPAVARRSCLMGASVYLGLGMIPVFIGLIGAQIVPGLQDPETILPVVAQRMLPPLLYAVFVGGLISAILSTVDTTLLSASALLSHNLVIPMCPPLDERRKLLISRVGVVACGLVAYGLAFRADGVLALVEEASAFGSAGIFVIVVFGLFTRFGDARSAAAALAAGMGVWTAGTYLADLRHPYILSLVASLVAYVLVGLSAGWGREPTPGPRTYATPDQSFER